MQKYTIGFTVHEARYLKSPDNNSMDVFVIVRCCGREYKTKVKQDVTDIASFAEASLWTDIYLYEDQFNTAVIEFEVQRRSYLWLNYVVGVATVQLEKVRKKKTHQFRNTQLPLKNQTYSSPQGYLKIDVFALGQGDELPGPSNKGGQEEEGAFELKNFENLNLAVLGNHDEAELRKSAHVLTVTIYRVDHLARRAFDILSNPYAVCRFDGFTLACPHARAVESHPFNVAFRIPVFTPVHEDHILVQLWHRGMISDEIIAQGRLSFSEVKNRRFDSRWFHFYGFDPEDIPDACAVTNKGIRGLEPYRVLGESCRVEVQVVDIRRATRWGERERAESAFDVKRALPSWLRTAEERERDVSSLSTFKFNETEGRVEEMNLLCPEDPDQQPKVGRYPLTTFPSELRGGGTREALRRPAAVLMSIEQKEADDKGGEKRLARKNLLEVKYDLRVYAYMARGLKSMDGEDPVPMIEIFCAGKQETIAAPSTPTSRPIWMKSLCMSVTLIADHSGEPSVEPVTLNVYNEADIQKGRLQRELIAQCTIPDYRLRRKDTSTDSFEEYDPHPQWVRLYKPSSNPLGATSGAEGPTAPHPSQSHPGAAAVACSGSLLHLMPPEHAGDIFIAVDLLKYNDVQRAKDEAREKKGCSLMFSTIGLRDLVLFDGAGSGLMRAVGLANQVESPRVELWIADFEGNSEGGGEKENIGDGYKKVASFRWQKRTSVLRRHGSLETDFSSSMDDDDEGMGKHEIVNESWSENNDRGGASFSLFHVERCEVSLPRDAVWDPCLTVKVFDERGLCGGDHFVGQYDLSLASRLPWLDDPSKANEKTRARATYDASYAVMQLETRHAKKRERKRQERKKQKRLEDEKQERERRRQLRLKGVKAGDTSSLLSEDEDLNEMSGDRSGGMFRGSEASASSNQLSSVKHQAQGQGSADDGAWHEVMWNFFRKGETGLVEGTRGVPLENFILRTVLADKNQQRVVKNSKRIFILVAATPPRLYPSPSQLAKSHHPEDKEKEGQSKGKKDAAMAPPSITLTGTSFLLEEISKLSDVRETDHRYESAQANHEHFFKRGSGTEGEKGESGKDRLDSSGDAEKRKDREEDAGVDLGGLKGRLIGKADDQGGVELEFAAEEAKRICGSLFCDYIETELSSLIMTTPPNLFFDTHFKKEKNDEGDKRTGGRLEADGNLEDADDLLGDLWFRNKPLTRGTNKDVAFGFIKSFTWLEQETREGIRRGEELKGKEIKKFVEDTASDPRALYQEFKVGVPSRLRLRLYAIKGHAVQCLGHPELVVAVGQTSLPKERYGKTESEPEFRKVLQTDIQLPRDWKLSMQIHDRTDTGSSLLGTSWLDLEDRWHSKKWGQFKEKGIVPKEYRNLLAINPLSKSFKRDANSSLACRENASDGRSAGVLECWVEMIEVGMISNKANRLKDISAPEALKMELRLVVWSTLNVKRVDGGKVDIMVEATLNCPSFQEKDPRRKVTQSTDTHRASTTGDGEFNWRMVWPNIGMPLEACTLTIGVRDVNVLSTSRIGEVTLNLVRYFDHVEKNLEPLNVNSELKLRAAPGVEEEEEGDAHLHSGGEGDADGGVGSVVVSLQVLRQGDADQNPLLV
uniref:C2 domain-containing protein n=1 Tax=Chromera velia CCMP2878 TaxID=1169474 RepID=A0A0G4IDD3_9ALVE|eukprot:Cvel_2334.t1-p1 / transcript=Cvel_2334.t1 / gene=Cvel_2334 / organism=Chromera_velia_CCMP2878 / gene_product=hypothetical protein / transcript_product=hypothetical protein / location=Cvel_scaffold90:43498-68957(+) / protein_length=1603 / sequence_SO=supercontig / SO=protein_coding / is_pseudo=false